MTVKTLCTHLHKDLLREFKYALCWGQVCQPPVRLSCVECDGLSRESGLAGTQRVGPGRDFEPRIYPIYRPNRREPSGPNACEQQEFEVRQ